MSIPCCVTLIAITACSRFLFSVIRFWHRVSENIYPFFCTESLKILQISCRLLLTLILNSFHKFSKGLRSGDWLVQCKIATLLSLNHFDVALAYVLGVVLSGACTRGGALGHMPPPPPPWAFQFLKKIYGISTVSWKFSLKKTKKAKSVTILLNGIETLRSV